MGNINGDWHKQNRMGKNPTELERINWHLEHVKNCSCRGIPKGVIELMRKNGIEIPENCL